MSWTLQRSSTHCKGSRGSYETKLHQPLDSNVLKRRTYLASTISVRCELPERALAIETVARDADISAVIHAREVMTGFRIEMQFENSHMYKLDCSNDQYLGVFIRFRHLHGMIRCRHDRSHIGAHIRLPLLRHRSSAPVLNIGGVRGRGSKCSSDRTRGPKRVIKLSLKTLQLLKLV